MATWRPKDNYRDRVNDLIAKRRSTAQGWTDYQQREQQKAEEAARKAEQEQERGWGVPALLGAGTGFLFGGPAGAAIGAGIGGGLGLARASSSRGGGIGGLLGSLTDPVGAVRPLMKNPAMLMGGLAALSPYMRGLKGGGGEGIDYAAGEGVSGYGGYDTGFGSEYGAGNYGVSYAPDLTLSSEYMPGGEGSMVLEEPGALEYGGGGEEDPLAWLLSEEEED